MPDEIEIVKGSKKVQWANGQKAIWNRKNSPRAIKQLTLCAVK